MKTSSLVSTLALSSFGSALRPQVLVRGAAASRGSSSSSGLEARDAFTDAVSALSAVYPFNKQLKDVSGIVTAADKFLTDILHFQDTQNEADCADVMLVFARGTSEPGNVGTLVGPPLEESLQSKLKSKGKTLAVQGVDYEASIAGFFGGGGDDGKEAMTTLVENTAKKCPDAKIVMGGYSQGCQVLHGAAENLGSTMKSVNSVVMFGDPLHSTKPDVAGIDSSKVKVYCNAGDLICKDQAEILIGHLVYGLDAPDATDFIMEQAGFA